MSTLRFVAGLVVAGMLATAAAAQDSTPPAAGTAAEQSQEDIVAHADRLIAEGSSAEGLNKKELRKRARAVGALLKLKKLDRDRTRQLRAILKETRQQVKAAVDKEYVQKPAGADGETDSADDGGGNGGPQVPDVALQDPGDLPNPPCAPNAGVVNVRDFGAAGSGAVNDTRALSNAMACLGTLLDNAGEAQLYIPAGVYAITGPLELKQSGKRPWKRLVIRGDSTFASAIQSRSTEGLFRLSFTQQVQVTVRDIKLVANVPAAGTALAVSMPAKQLEFSSLTVNNVIATGRETGNRDYFSNGVVGEGLNKPVFRDYFFRRVGTKPAGDSINAPPKGTSCITLRGGYGAEIVGQSRCHYTNIGVDVAQAGGEVHINARSFGVYVMTGVKIDGGALRIEATHFKPIAWAIDARHVSSLKLTEALLLNEDKATDELRGAVRVSDSTNISIRNNLFWRTTRNQQRTTIAIGKGVKDAVIANNAFNEGGTAVDVAEGSSGIKVTNNRFLDVARKVGGAESAVTFRDIAANAQ